MKLRLTYHPVQNWQVSVPAGKSQSHRALITAALATGTSVLEKLPDNEDIGATLRSTPGLPVHHQLLEFTQTHVH